MDLTELRREEVAANLSAALAVAFLAVPSGVAYALIAGIPPAMGLYTATIPTIVGSLMRSSRQVVTGPTNAISLLVGAAVATHPDLDPAEVAITLASMVAAMQLAAGFLRLGSLVDFISHPVVVGYVTAAGLLIGVGQLHHITGTEGGHGHLAHKLSVWVGGLGETDPMAVAMALATICVMVGVRRAFPRAPAAILTMTLAIGANVAFGLDAYGLVTIADLAPISSALPSLTLPNLEIVGQLWPVAVAVALLSVVESSSVARALASRSGQRLDLSVEFTGEGFANLTASLFGGYPTTGSLSRSALNEREGATSRLAGALSGVFVLLAVLVGAPLLNRTPVASLAGLLMVVAAGLIDIKQIRELMRSQAPDRIAFGATVLGAAWELDKAIYFGVAISLILFIRRASLVSVRDLAWDDQGRLREFSARRRELGAEGFCQAGARYCRRVHIVNLAGSLFFGSAGQIQVALDEVVRNPEVEVLVLRLKRARDLDLTTVHLLLSTQRTLAKQGRHLILVGMRPGLSELLQRLGAAEEFGADKLFARDDDHWFAALEHALEHAHTLCTAHDADCPLEPWLAERAAALS